jgi:hypothetical protein
MYLLLAIIVIVILSSIFSVAARQNILAALQAGGYVAQGIWRRLWHAAGGAGRALLVLFAANFVLFALMGFVGDAPLAGIALGVVIPVWILFFFLRPLALIPVVGPAIGSIVRPIWVGLSFIVVPCLLFLAFGLWSPVMKRDFDRWSDGKKIEAGNFLVKNAVHSEAEAGVLAYTEEDTDLLDERLEPWRKDISKGTRVKIIGLRENLKDSDEHEGLTEVMLPDNRGRYLKGDRGYVPSRILAWKKKEAEPVVSPPPPPAPEPVAAPAPPPVQMALLPGQQPAPAPQPTYTPPPPPPQPEFVIPAGMWMIHMLSGQEVWAQFAPNGQILVKGEWINGQYILREVNWRGLELGCLQRVGPKQLRGSFAIPGLRPAEIKIEFRDAQGGMGAVGWGGRENAFQIRSF